MAQVSPIFQPVTAGHRHVDQLCQLASEPWLSSLVLSTAFANAAGIAALAGAIAPVADRCRAFVGVRNGSTTAQALTALLALKVEVYGVDTAMRGRIFHPKLYLAIGDDHARAIVGSANLTHAGLHNNMEASADLSLDMNDGGDKAFVDHFTAEFARLIANFPNHCFPISSGKQVVELMRQGLLEDERNPKTQTAMGAGSQGLKTAKARIALPYVAPPRTQRVRKPKLPVATAGAAMSAVPHYGRLVWAKPSLPPGDLQLLTKGHTSGVLRLTQAKFRVGGKLIDKTTYFRNDLFGGLVWKVQGKKEVAAVPASLVIAGVYVGDFDFQISHDPAWAAGQDNYTTGLHWHGATAHIKSPGLVGRTLRLYEPALAGGRFVIEID